MFTELGTIFSAVQKKKLVLVRYLWGTEPDGRIQHNIVVSLSFDFFFGGGGHNRLTIFSYLSHSY